MKANGLPMRMTRYRPWLEASPTVATATKVATGGGGVIYTPVYCIRDSPYKANRGHKIDLLPVAVRRVLPGERQDVQHLDLGALRQDPPGVVKRH
jgi:hypothetical protein